MLDEPVARTIVRPDASVKMRGWAYLLEGTPLMLHVVVGEHEVAVASSWIYRPGVAHRFGDKTNGYVGFDVELPATVLLGRKGGIEVHRLQRYGPSRAFALIWQQKRRIPTDVSRTHPQNRRVFGKRLHGGFAWVSARALSHIEGHPEWEFFTGPDIEDDIGELHSG